MSQVRAMLMGTSDGKIISAMLQELEGFDTDGNIYWKDVMLLEVSPDGVVTLPAEPVRSLEKAE